MARKHRPFLIGDLLVGVPPEAQGFRIIAREGGVRDAYWYASDIATGAGYPIKTVRLRGSLDVLDDVECMFGHCAYLQSQMLEWLTARRERFTQGRTRP